MDQQLWNILFGWITGKQCFLPEGCDPPPAGVLFYVLLAVAVIGAITYRDRI